jgi:ribonuclease P protein component
MAVSCPGVKLFMNRNGLAHNRVAISFPRKYGNAVERNHSRRLSRETYRLLQGELRQGYDLALLVFPGRDVFSLRMEQLRFLFSRAGLLNLTSGDQE